MDHPIPTAQPRRSRLPRALAILTAAALAASGVALGAGPANAAAGDIAVTNASLTWGFNNYAAFVVGATSGDVVAAPAISPRGFTATKGTGTVDSTGSGEIDFTGSVQYNNPTQGNVINLFTLTDLQLAVSGGTEGTLTGAVSSLGAPYFDASKNGTRVTLATFDVTSDTSTPGMVSYTSAVPDYLPSTASTNGSWPIDFVNLWTGGKSFFYSSGSDPTTASNVSKKPVALTATTTALNVAVSSSYPTTGGLDVAVTANGIAALNAGVYVGFGPVGLDLAQTTDMAYSSNFTAAQFIPAASIGSGGSVSTTLHLDKDKLATGTSYSVYTWNAHAHATTANDSITAVTFDYASLVVPSTPQPTPAKTASSTTVNPVTARFGTSATLVAAVPATATGTVTFASDGVTIGSVPVSAGAASIATSATTGVGSHTITAVYSGDALFAGSTSAAATLTVAKATVSVAVTGSKFAKSSKPKVTVTVGTLANGTRVAGKVAVYVGKTKVKTVSVTSAKRVVSVTLPNKYSKAISVRAKFLGGATTVAKTSKTIKLAVKK